MNYTQRILRVLNKPIKDGEMKWSFYKYREVQCGWEIGFHVPLGSSFEKAEKFLPELVATCGHDIEMDEYKGLIVVRIIEKPMKLKIQFEPKMLEGLKPSEILIGYSVTAERITFDWSLPHGIVAAETGMGKTDFLRLLVYCLLHDKRTVDIRIIDMKMLSFLPFRKVPNITLGIGWEGAVKMIEAAAEEVNKRNKDVFDSGSRKMTKHLQKIVVIIDEAAEIALKAATLTEEKAIAKRVEKAIITIARMGREVKVHLIYCTQYPTADIVSQQIRINCGMRLCFYVPEEKQSEVVLQRGGAEKLNAIPGRAIFKDHRYSTVQVPFVGDDDKWEKMLIPFKTEVIQIGSSSHSDKERNIVDGSYESADSVNETDSDAVQKQLLANQEGKPTFAGTFAGKVDRVRLAPPIQNMAANQTGIDDDEWI